MKSKIEKYLHFERPIQFWTYIKQHFELLESSISMRDLLSQDFKDSATKFWMDPNMQPKNITPLMDIQNIQMQKLRFNKEAFKSIHRFVWCNLVQTINLYRSMVFIVECSSIVVLDPFPW